MKKNLFVYILLLLLVYSNKNLAQEFCGTPSPTPPDWIFTSTRSTTSHSSGYVINIFVHVLRNSAGKGTDAIEVTNNILERLNRYFKPANLQFKSIGYEYINDDSYYTEVKIGNQTNALFNRNRHANAIDIYVLSSFANFLTEQNRTITGLSQSIPAQAIIINFLAHTSISVVHEIGHCLGLYHTHHGTAFYEEGTNDEHQCAELVNGSNAHTCGDYIADTPADPYNWHECSYSGDGVDANGQSYNPDPKNLMSYASPFCREYFTPMQIQRMKDFIERTPALKKVVERNFNISGPPSLMEGDTYSIENLPTGATVTWSISPTEDFRTDRGRNNTAKVVSYGYNKTGILQATISHDGKTFIVEKTIQTPELEIIGDDYLSCGYKLYKLNYVPEIKGPDSSDGLIVIAQRNINWKVANGMKKTFKNNGINLKGNSEIYVSSDGVTSPWIEVQIDGITKRKNLNGDLLEEAEISFTGKTTNSTYGKLYWFTIFYYPWTIPEEELFFCWNNQDITASGEYTTGTAQIITGAEIGTCDSIPTPPPFVYIGPPIRPLNLTPWPEEPILKLPYDELCSAAIRVGNTYKGVFTCTVGDYCGNKFTKSFQIFNGTVTECTTPRNSIQRSRNNMQTYNVSPNPASTILTIIRSDDNPTDLQPISINLNNDYGQIRNITSDSLEKEIHINVADLPNGIYYMNIIQNGEIINRQIIFISH